MSKPLPVTEFLSKSRHIPMVDVRTPAEYAQGHIPQAFNIPLFTNEERAEVGTLYVQQSRRSAVMRGLELVGPKLAAFATRAQEIAAQSGQDYLLVHCWRGGMRSASMAWLFEQAGLHCYTLEKGYKAYRTLVIEYFQHFEPTLTVLGGYTGSGKTERLQQLTAAGEQVVDLEGLACHKGSAFGSLGQEPQPSTEHFENLLHRAFTRLDLSRPVWVEDESRNVGKCSLPAGLWAKMETARFELLERPLEERVQRLYNEYGHFGPEDLCACIAKIEKRLGREQCVRALDACRQGNTLGALRICLAYYDKSYGYQITERLKKQLPNAK